MTLSLSQAIATSLTGTPDPVCELCGVSAFVSHDGHLYCKTQWQQGACDPPPPAPPTPTTEGDDIQTLPVLCCPHCHDDGRACWDCGHLDTPSIGRKLVFLHHNDRPTLIQILRGTQRQFWPLLAQAYVAALGATEAGQTVPALGVVGLWELLTA